MVFSMFVAGLLAEAVSRLFSIDRLKPLKETPNGVQNHRGKTLG